MSGKPAPVVDCPLWPLDALKEAAAKLNVALLLLREHGDRCTSTVLPDESEADDSEGWDLGVAEDLIRDIRDLLIKSAKAAQKEAAQ